MSSAVVNGLGRRTAVASSLLLALALAPLVARAASAKKEKEKDVYQSADVGKDPQPFTGAVGMYGAARVDGCEASARTVTAAILAGRLPESDEVAALLPALAPCAGRESTQETAARWAELAAEMIRARGKPGMAAELAQANLAYKKGDFEKAALAYRRVLAAAPGHLDARNNLGLAELHAGNDVAAEVHLEVLRRLEPTYVPGLVNLTVVCERLGLRGRAEALAREALKQQKQYPPAAYNAAWLANAAGDYDEAAELLAPVLPVKSNPIHDQLADLNEKLRAKEKATALLVEEFDDTKLGWKVWPNGESYDAVFEKGSYVINTKNDKCSLEEIHPPFDVPSSFDVELRSTWQSGVKNKAYGLALGVDRDRYYHFAISGNGQSTAIDSDKNAPDPCGWQMNSAIPDGSAANRQTVQVRGNRILYLVNGHPIVAFQNRHQLSGRDWVIAVRVCGAEKVAFDQLRILKR